MHNSCVTIHGEQAVRSWKRPASIDIPIFTLKGSHSRAGVLSLEVPATRDCLILRIEGYHSKADHILQPLHFLMGLPKELIGFTGQECLKSRLGRGIYSHHHHHHHPPHLPEARRKASQASHLHKSTPPGSSCAESLGRSCPRTWQLDGVAMMGRSMGWLWLGYGWLVGLWLVGWLVGSVDVGWLVQLMLVGRLMTLDYMMIKNGLP